MRTINLSATDLDGVDYLLSREDAACTPAEVRARLLHTDVPGEPAAIGSAFHAAIESGAALGPVAFESGGYVFQVDADLAIPDPGEMHQEASATGTWEVRASDGRMVRVRVRLRVDALRGLRVTDWKTTLGQFDAEKYLSSYQWRIYLDVLDADLFDWYVFTGRQNGRTVYINDLHRLEACRYPAMGEDVVRALTRLVDLAVAYVPELLTEEA